MIQERSKLLILTMLFAVVLFFDLYAVYDANLCLELLTKPLLMPLLVVYYLVVIKQPKPIVILALFFSFLGDVLLVFEKAFFMYGLISFLIAHVLYITLVNSYKTKINKTNVIIVLIVFVMFILSLLYTIHHHAGAMILPIVIYAVTISIFGILSVLNFISSKTQANLYMLLGASIFIVSDSLIAINKFYSAHSILNIFIMMTYCLAQYLIILSEVKRENDY